MYKNRKREFVWHIMHLDKLIDKWPTSDTAVVLRVYIKQCMQTFIEFGWKNIRNMKIEASYQWDFQMRELQIIRSGGVIVHLLASDDKFIIRILIKQCMHIFIEFARTNIRIIDSDADSVQIMCEKVGLSHFWKKQFRLILQNRLG